MEWKVYCKLKYFILVVEVLLAGYVSSLSTFFVTNQVGLCRSGNDNQTFDC